MSTNIVWGGQYVDSVIPHHLLNGRRNIALTERLVYRETVPGGRAGSGTVRGAEYGRHEGLLLRSGTDQGPHERSVQIASWGFAVSHRKKLPGNNYFYTV